MLNCSCIKKICTCFLFGVQQYLLEICMFTYMGCAEMYFIKAPLLIASLLENNGEGTIKKKTNAQVV